MNRIAEAWDNTKAKEDPEYAGIAQTLRDELGIRADGVDRTGIAVTNFEIEYKKLGEKERKANAKKNESPMAVVAPEAVNSQAQPSEAETIAAKAEPKAAEKKAEAKTEATKTAAKKK